MYCDVVWGGFKVVWVVLCVLGCFYGPRQYITVFSVTNYLPLVFDWFTISYSQIQVIPMKTRPQWSIKPHVLILINYICDLPMEDIHIDPADASMVQCLSVGGPCR